MREHYANCDHASALLGMRIGQYVQPLLLLIQKGARWGSAKASRKGKLMKEHGVLFKPEANLKAENERLKETAKIAIQEIGAWSRKAGKLEAENERLKKTIREQGEQVQHLADNLKEARDENERLKAALPATRCT